MTAAPVLFHVESPYVTRNLRERIIKVASELSDDIAKGIAGSYEDYKYLVGRRTGLLEVIDMLDELEKQERN